MTTTDNEERIPLNPSASHSEGTMKISQMVIGVVAILVISTAILAQDRKALSRNEMNKYVVSAKAGVVNIIDGDVTVARVLPFAVADAPRTLITGDELKSGDVVNTGVNGRVEILLDPGCYLRLGERSQFVFLYDNMETDKLKLTRGSAVLEASTIEIPISIETPRNTIQIIREGLYRFNVDSDGKVDVAVRKGRAMVGSTTIKEGKHALVEGDTAAIAKLDKKDVDDLDGWSKERARSLIAANRGLSSSGMRRTLSRSLLYNAWIYDPFSHCYTFLPFGGGFASPYGWDYSVLNPFFSYFYYYPPRRYNNGSGPNSGSGSSSGGGTQAGGGGSRAGGGSRGGVGSNTGAGSRAGGGGHTGGPSLGGGSMRMPSPPSFGGSADRGAAKGSASPSRGKSN